MHLDTRKLVIQPQPSTGWQEGYGACVIIAYRIQPGRQGKAYLWCGIRPNFPDKQLTVSAQAEQVVSKDQQLQDGSCMPLVAPMPSQT